MENKDVGNPQTEDFVFEIILKCQYHYGKHRFQKSDAVLILSCWQNSQSVLSKLHLYV